MKKFHAKFAKKQRRKFFFCQLSTEYYQLYFAFHASTPPIRLRTLVKPCCFKNACAFALRFPDLQWTITSSFLCEESSSIAPGKVASGINLPPILNCMSSNYGSSDSRSHCILLYSLNSDEFVLRKGYIPMYVKPENNEFYIEIPQFGISEYHDSLSEIGQDIPNYIIDLYNHLSKIPDNKLSKFLSFVL